MNPTARSQRSLLLAHLPPDMLHAVRACLDGVAKVGYCPRPIYPAAEAMDVALRAYAEARPW